MYANGTSMVSTILSCPDIQPLTIKLDLARLATIKEQRQPYIYMHIWITI